MGNEPARILVATGGSGEAELADRASEELRGHRYDRKAPAALRGCAIH